MSAQSEEPEADALEAAGERDYDPTEARNAREQAEQFRACAYPGCPNHGAALFRTSPKGEPFQGMCEEHHPSVDPELARITDVFDGEAFGD